MTVSLFHQITKLKSEKMLFQDTMTAHTGLEIRNMTNDVLSNAAIEAIVNELLDKEIESVGVTCTFSGSDTDGDWTQFDVWEGENYLFSVDNEGFTYDK
jgi:hypothetical protein